MTPEALENHFRVHHAELPPFESTERLEADHRADHDGHEGITVPHRHTPLGVICETDLPD